MKSERKTSKVLKRVTAVGFALVMVGCGMQEKEDQKIARDSDDTVAADSSLVGDAKLTEEGMSAGLSDGLESLADSHLGSQSASLALFGGKFTDHSTYRRACEVQDRQAKVTVSATIDRSQQFENRRRLVERSVEGNGDITRLWSREGGSVGCDESEKYADIERKSDFAGLSVAVDFQRQRRVQFSHTGKLSGRSFRSERQFSANGERSVNWTAQEIDETADTLIRHLEIASKVERKHTKENSRGQSKELQLVVETKADAPLLVDVERKYSNLQLVSKTIASGEIKVQRRRDGHLEAKFESLKVVYDEEECRYESGSVTFKIFKDGEEKPSKTKQFIVENGEYKLIDVDTGEIHADFEPEQCFLGDYKRG